MKKIAALLLSGSMLMAAGCTYLPGGTDLSDVAMEAGLTNVTTGDGEFSRYTATGHYTGTEIGIAVGLPFIVKLVEIFPMNSNEALLGDVAAAAKADGADAMINVTPHKALYTGFPFGIVGLYVDTAEGTGIKTK